MGDYDLTDLEPDEFNAACEVITNMRRKKADEAERKHVLDNLTVLWPDRRPVIYIAQQNSDLTEGRGPNIPKGYFIDRELAHRVNESLPGVMGTNNTAPVKVERIYLTFAEWKDARGK